MTLVCVRDNISHKLSQEKADVIFKVMANSVNQKIIVCIKDEFKILNEISRETELSLSTVSRKIGILNKNKLVRITGEINYQGRKIIRFQSKINKVQIVFDENEIDMKVYLSSKELK